jgi:hypothetical protein
VSGMSRYITSGCVRLPDWLPCDLHLARTKRWVSESAIGRWHGKEIKRVFGASHGDLLEERRQMNVLLRMQTHLLEILSLVIASRNPPDSEA